MDTELIVTAAKQAGEIASKYFCNTNEVWTKSGDSPVSEADFAVDAFLKDALLTARPDYGWLSEETEDNAERLSQETVFVVDPIDGTRGFLAGRPEWCVSIGIVTNNRPVAGVLVCPALEQTFWAALGAGSWLNDKRINKLTNTNVSRVTASRKLNDLIEERFADSLEVHPFVPSLAYRIAMVATSQIDAAFARPGANDWDLAAAEIILNESGGIMSDTKGASKQYNQIALSSGALLASSKSAQEKLMKLANSAGFLH